MDHFGPEQHPDVAAEATQRAGQALAVLATLGEAAARLAAEGRRRRERREETQAQVQQRQAEQQRDLHTHGDRLAEHAARQRAVHDRRLMDQASDPTWVRNADLYDLATVWRTARARERDPHFPEARVAAETIEDQLRDMYPRPMHLYDEAVRAGVPQAEAMRTAAAEMARTPVMRPYGPGTRAGALTAPDEPVIGNAAFTSAVADEQIRLATGADPNDFIADLKRLPGGEAAAEALREVLARRAATETAQAQQADATQDNPTTATIDERTVSGPATTTAAGEANRDNAASKRTAADLAGEWYPQGINHPHAMPQDIASRRPATTGPAHTAGRTAGLSR